MQAQQAIAAGCQVQAIQLPLLAPRPCPQLSYIHRLFDVEGLLHSLESPEAREAAEQKLEPIRWAWAIQDRAGLGTMQKAGAELHGQPGHTQCLHAATQ